MKKITVLGGGTGAFVVLSGLKKHNSLDLSAIVSMADSGGSTGKLRDQLGVLPPGDLRQCLVALSEAPNLWRKLFLYRFKTGDLKGHNFGNIFLSALQKVSKDYNEVIALTSYVLKTKGTVIPVTFEKANLSVKYANGKIVQGEGEIDENWKEDSRIAKALLLPAVSANPASLERIRESDFIIIGPGDLYTSIIPILLVNKMKDALKKTNARIIFIMNLMTKGGQTTDYTARDHISDLEKYLGKAPDVVIINTSKIPEEVIGFYSPENQRPVKNGSTIENFRGKIIKAEVIEDKIYKKKEEDLVNPVMRSILRHDARKLSTVLMNIFND